MAGCCFGLWGKRPLALLGPLVLLVASLAVAVLPLPATAREPSAVEGRTQPASTAQGPPASEIQGQPASPADERADPEKRNNASPPVRSVSLAGDCAKKAHYGASSFSPGFSGEPFEGLTLEQLAGVFAQAYAGCAPRQWGEHLPGVTRRLAPDMPDRPSETAARDAHSLSAVAAGPPLSPAEGVRPMTLALTLDACDGRKGTSYDAGLIAFLRERRIPATIFVTSIWMRNNPEALRDLAADPLFAVEAHGSRHKPCSVNGKSVYGIKGTASFDELVREVEGNARDIAAATGRRPRWFRAGTAYYDDVAVRVIRDLDLGIAGYSIAGDEGASLPAGKVAAKTLAARDGDILLYHLNHPASGTREGLERALPVLLEKGCVFVLLPSGGAASRDE